MCPGCLVIWALIRGFSARGGCYKQNSLNIARILSESSEEDLRCLNWKAFSYIEENIYIGDDQLEALVNIKSREELIGEIITLLQSPAKNVISALQSGGGKLSGILQTLSKK